MTAEQLQQIRENEKEDIFEFIQQALHRIDAVSETYTEVNATIWLTKGDHFFFYCDELIDDPEALGDSASSTSGAEAAEKGAKSHNSIWNS